MENDSTNRMCGPSGLIAGAVLRVEVEQPLDASGRVAGHMSGLGFELDLDGQTSSTPSWVTSLGSYKRKYVALTL